MNTLRRVHLYLGCFFAPMLAFFCISGIWQVFGLQWEDNAHVLKLLSTIHMGHNLRSKGPGYTLTSPWLEYFAVAMAVSLLVSLTLGIVLAFKYGRGTLALISLACGILIPLGLILLFAHSTS